MNDRHGESSSFDLFLDTICNAFGGIVFLAILLAILIQTRAIVKSPEQMDESPITADQVRELVVQLDDAQSQHADISDALSKLPLAETSADDTEFRSLSTERQEAEDELAKRLHTQSELSEQLAEKLAKNAEIREDLLLIPVKLRDVDSTAEQKTAELTSLVKNRQTTLRLPRDRPSSRLSALVLLRGARIYLAKSLADAGQTFNDKQVNAQPSLGGGFLIEPRLGTGWDLQDLGWVAVIDQARSSNTIVTVAVWPESYGDFSVLKQALIEKNVQYQLWPQKAGEELILSFGTGENRVQ